jgi:hypothetical protein
MLIKFSTTNELTAHVAAVVVANADTDAMTQVQCA